MVIQNTYKLIYYERVVRKQYKSDRKGGALLAHTGRIVDTTPRMLYANETK